jgi:hypothetical protein
MSVPVLTGCFLFEQIIRENLDLGLPPKFQMRLGSPIFG